MLVCEAVKQVDIESVRIYFEAQYWDYDWSAHRNVLEHLRMIEPVTTSDVVTVRKIDGEIDVSCVVPGDKYLHGIEFNPWAETLGCELETDLPLSEAVAELIFEMTFIAYSETEIAGVKSKLLAMKRKWEVDYDESQ